ncbi:MAG: hypothetical protein MMC33_009468 [Icmadophila ericetorum]|nr:hypothetical protein [Icmadophila ericetorum]
MTEWTSPSPPGNPPKYWLKTLSKYPSSQSPTISTQLYLRWHGSGINSIVCTPSPPKFLRGYTIDSATVVSEGEEGKGAAKKKKKKIVYVTEGRKRMWGLTLTSTSASATEEEEKEEEGGGDDGVPEGMHPVEFVENGGDGCFEWGTGDEDEDLMGAAGKNGVGRSEGNSSSSSKEVLRVRNGEEGKGWGGWVLRGKGVGGHVQLYWRVRSSGQGKVDANGEGWWECELERERCPEPLLIKEGGGGS